MRRTARRINYKAAAFYVWTLAAMAFIFTNIIVKFTALGVIQW